MTPTEHTQNTLVSIGLAFVILFLVFEVKVFLFLSILVLFGFLLRLKFLVAFALVWQDVLKFLGTTLSNVILVFIFIFFITPYSVVYRIFHKEKVAHFRGVQSEKNSYFIDSDSRAIDKAFFEKLW